MMRACSTCQSRHRAASPGMRSCPAVATKLATIVIRNRFPGGQSSMPGTQKGQESRERRASTLPVWPRAARWCVKAEMLVCAAGRAEAPPAKGARSLLRVTEQVVAEERCDGERPAQELGDAASRGDRARASHAAPIPSALSAPLSSLCRPSFRLCCWTTRPSQPLHRAQEAQPSSPRLTTPPSVPLLPEL